MGAHKTPLDVWAAPNQGEEGLQMPGLTSRVKCEFKPNHKLIKIIPELYFIIMGELWRVRLLTNNIAARSGVVVGLHKTPVRCVFCFLFTLLFYFILFSFCFCLQSCRGDIDIGDNAADTRERSTTHNICMSYERPGHTLQIDMLANQLNLNVDCLFQCCSNMLAWLRFASSSLAARFLSGARTGYGYRLHHRIGGPAPSTTTTENTTQVGWTALSSHSIRPCRTRSVVGSWAICLCPYRSTRSPIDRPLFVSDLRSCASSYLFPILTSCHSGGPDTVAIAVGVLVKISERYVPFGDHFRKALNERLSKNEAQWKDVLALKEIEILSIRSHIVIVDRDVHVPPL